ncbi:MAG: Tm-1-like ATP-binding domain-containing protein [Pusillimonas sp.]
MSAGSSCVWVVGTFDTKAQELDYVAGLMREAGVSVVTVDIGTSGGGVASADISAPQVASHHPDGATAVLEGTDRGAAVMAMAVALQRLVQSKHQAGHIAGMLGLGGSGGASMIAPAMHCLPIGMPKLLVSTMAAGNVAPLVDIYDVMLLYPVTDFAGLNRLSRVILANAAQAMTGMMQAVRLPAGGDVRPSLGLSMFGVTTPCVQQVCGLLSDDFDCQVFHANGIGGRTLEALARAGMLRAVVDVTTTEVGQNLAAGVCDAGPGRLAAAAEFGIPWVGSVGALDMINWGPPDTVPAQHRDRNFCVHNAQVTLMRSTAQELALAGRRLAARLNQSPGPVRLLLPLAGLSALDAPGKPFHDPAANAALFAAIEDEFMQTDTHHLAKLDRHINDPEFAQALAKAVREVLE